MSQQNGMLNCLPEGARNAPRKGQQLAHLKLPFPQEAAQNLRYISISTRTGYQPQTHGYRRESCSAFQSRWPSATYSWLLHPKPRFRFPLARPAEHRSVPGCSVSQHSGKSRSRASCPRVPALPDPAGLLHAPPSNMAAPCPLCDWICGTALLPPQTSFISLPLILLISKGPFHIAITHFSFLLTVRYFPLTFHREANAFILSRFSSKASRSFVHWNPLHH